MRVEQALGLGVILRQLEHVAQLPRRLVGPLFGLPLQAFAEEPGGGAIRIIAVLVVAPLLRHRARPGVHVQSALAAPCRSSCRTVEDFLHRHADHRGSWWSAP